VARNSGVKLDDRNRAAAGTAAPWLAAIDAERAAFEAAARRAEDERTLPTDIVELMRALRLFWLKTPVALGGSELAPAVFSEILEQLAYFDASAAWSAMVGNGATGIMAGWLPDAAIGEIFGDPDRLPIFAGQFLLGGTATPAPGGYRVSGRWRFCSGIEHADWVVGCCEVDGPGDSEVIAVCLPKEESTLHDTWYVAGLQGTGSGDFSLSATFVPATWTFDWEADGARRGGPLYRQPQVLFVANELSPVAVGIARRAIDDMLELAAATTRKGSAGALADRAVFQREIARAAAAVRSLQLLYRDAVARCWDATLADRAADPALITRTLAEHTFVVHSCADVVATLFRYGGGRALALSHPMQRHVRNLAAAAQHVFVSDESYERSGRLRLEAARDGGF
jgi:alkylation response protein AidB-like acyl-CoA dehydrogenase